MASKCVPRFDRVLGVERMSNPERDNSQECGKGRALEDSLQPKKSAMSCEGEALQKRDAQRLGNENASLGPLQSNNDPLSLEGAFTNSTSTENEPPHIHTEELRHTGELCHTGELYAHTEELHTYTDKLNEKDLRFHKRLKITKKLIGNAD